MQIAQKKLDLHDLRSEIVLFTPDELADSQHQNRVRTMLDHMAPERSTEELLEAAVGGDAVAWQQLVEQFQPAVWGATSRLGLRQSEAEEVFQTVWLRLIERHETIRDPARLAGWIKTVARNEGLAILRRSARTEPSDVIDLAANAVDGPEVDVIRRARSELVMAGFRQLSERCQDVLYMSANKKSYVEIAEKVGLNPNSVSSIKARCLETLRSFSEIKQVMEPAE